MDCLVVGDGIAGLSTAIHVAQNTETSVALVSNSKYRNRFRIGEIVPPLLKPELSHLGVWEDFKSQKHVASVGVTSWWNSELPFDRDFIFDPNGKGWNIDRALFESSLLSKAVELGVRIIECDDKYELIKLIRGGWLFLGVSGTSSHKISATILVNATGRSKGLSRITGKRVSLDRLVAYAQYFDVSAHEDSWNSRLWIESTQNGWWYSALLPGGKAIAVFLSDSDINKGAPLNVFTNNLVRSVSTRNRLDDSLPTTKVTVCAANTTRVDLIDGNSAVTVGDASFTSDPLRGRGIIQCLVQARKAGEAILAHLVSSRDLTEQYNGFIRREFESYYSRLAETYSEETRWSDSLFWQRRKAKKGI